MKTAEKEERKAMKLALSVCAVSSLLRAVAHQTDAPSQWEYAREDDALHAKVHDRFILEGVYLTPPRLATRRPAIVVECSGGKVEHNYFSVGAVVDKIGDTVLGAPLIAGFEARIDGKKTVVVGPDHISTDGQVLYFSKVGLANVLNANQVIVGANEYLGPQVVMRFDIPDSSPVMKKCGSDRMLKRKKAKGTP